MLDANNILFMVQYLLEYHLNFHIKWFRACISFLFFPSFLLFMFLLIPNSCETIGGMTSYKHHLFEDMAITYKANPVVNTLVLAIIIPTQISFVLGSVTYIISYIHYIHLCDETVQKVNLPEIEKITSNKINLP